MCLMIDFRWSTDRTRILRGNEIGTYCDASEKSTSYKFTIIYTKKVQDQTLSKNNSWFFEKPPFINSHVGGLGYWNENRYKEYERVGQIWLSGNFGYSRTYKNKT